MFDVFMFFIFNVALQVKNKTEEFSLKWGEVTCWAKEKNIFKRET